MQNYSPDTDGNGIPDDQESRRTISRAAYEHNLGVLREVHGVGSLQVQSYVGWWEPDTENQDTLFTTKETNDLLNEILANQTLVAFAGVNDGGVRFATQIASQESTETLLAGDASLDRWWATAGENPIDTTWTATITREGNYYLRVLSEQWDFDSAVITNNGTLVDMQSGKTDYMHLSPGIYTFQFRGVGVPTTPTVEEVNFSLVNINGLDYTYSNDFDAMFIADRPEIDTNQQFNILTDNVCIVANGVQKLIETFAPNLHFSQGEDYAMPYSIDAYQIHTDGNANGEIDVNVAPSSSPTIYASVVQDGDRLAINYHFFYPKSNWHTKGGFNDHEGDWEGVTVFLNKDGEHWVKGGIALAQHTQLFSEGIETEHNDGGAYYDNWTGIGGTHPNVYVGLGGHASYLHPDTYDVIPATTYDEIAEGDGTVLWHDAVDAVFTPRVGSGESDILDALRFSGYWGAEDLEDEWIGDSAPQGPVFTSNGYEPGLRWMDPWEWGEKFK